jgi:hypothetical protein
MPPLLAPRTPQDPSVDRTQLPDVNCQLTQPPSNAAAYATMHHDKVRSWGISLSGDFYGLGYSGEIFAMLNKKTCHQLRQLTESRQAQFIAYATNDAWITALGSWNKKQGHAILVVDVNIYGIHADATNVGDILSREGAFLQRPIDGQIGVAYYNPHYLPLQHSSHADLKGKGSEIAKRHVSQPELERSSDILEMDTILNSLAHHGDLHEQQADRRLKSPLLP